MKRSSGGAPLLILTARAAPQTQLRMTMEVPGAPPSLSMVREIVRNVAIGAFGINPYTAELLAAKCSINAPVQVIPMAVAEELILKEIHRILLWWIYFKPSEEAAIRSLVNIFQLSLSAKYTRAT